MRRLPHKMTRWAVSHACMADDLGPEWRHIRPRLVGLGGRGGGPWTGITSAGSVSGLELRRACFFVCLSPSAPWEYSPFLGVLHLEMARKLTTTRVVEGELSTPVGQGWAERMVVGAVHDRWHYFYTFVCRGSALLVARKEPRGLET